MEKRLVAAAAVHVAVHVKGQAKVTLAKGANTVTLSGVCEPGINFVGFGFRKEGEKDDESTVKAKNVEFLVPQAEKAGILRKQGKIIRHKTLVQMLTEQSILADIEQNRSDRHLDAFHAGLALAAVGFHQLRSWLSQLALLLPVSLLVISLARPDSQEALAMRLHEELGELKMFQDSLPTFHARLRQELEANLHKGPVKVVTARGQFL
eukprot:Skav209291  [mRNA]  locus=scaffold251:152526:154463:+ [translate_table: standard]